MIQPVTTTSVSVPVPAAAKPWAPGDPSSFAQLFSPLGETSVATPVSPAPAPPVIAAPAVAATPADAAATVAPAPMPQLTFEQQATVTGYGTSSPMNPEELATADTASRLAAMLGGTVVNEPDYGGGWAASVPTRDIAFEGSNGSTTKLNAGVLAYLFNTYGDAPGSQAWQQVDKTLGRDPASTTPVS